MPIKRWRRTQNRPLATQAISTRNALLFATALVLFGTLLLIFYVNLLTAMIALFGFAVYVLVYSFSKYRSVHGTLIGSIAGAVPPVVGYCAVSNHLDHGRIAVIYHDCPVADAPFFCDRDLSP